MGELRGKTAIITGGAGHTAKGIAKLFAKEGATVVGLDINEAALADFTFQVESVGGQAMVLGCNLSDWDNTRGAIEQVVSRFGGIDILVNTATTRTDPVWKGIEAVSHAEVTRLIEVGPLGALGVMQAVFPHMKEKGGKIINFGSGGGRNPFPGLGAYGVSKAAMHSLTKVAAKEWARYRINVNGILPFVMTPLLQKSMDENPSLEESLLPPLGWIGDAEIDIGRVALFLASSASDYVTGQNIPVDGGTDMVM